MNTSSQNGFKRHLSLMLRVDREFREEFTDLLLKYKDGNVLELTESLVANVWKSGIPYVMDIQRGLIDLLSDREMIIFIRVMKLTERRIPWSRRLRNIAFSDDTGIDLFRISNTAWRLPQFRVFDFLDNEERAVLEQLSTTEIDFISDLTTSGFNLFLTISQFSKEKISFLLSLETRQIDLMIKFGFENTRSLANYGEGTRNMLLESYPNGKLKGLLMDGIFRLGMEERTGLRDLIDRLGAKIRDFGIKENMDEALVNIGDCSEQDRTALGMGTLTSFHETETKILKRISIDVFKLASSLTRSELDEILLLPKGMLRTMSSSNFRDSGQDFPEGYPLAPKTDHLEEMNGAGLRLLNHDQRTVLARIHKLPPRAVGLLLDLDPDRIKGIMINFQWLWTPDVIFNRTKQYLLRKLKTLSPQDRHAIAWMTDKDWNSFHSIRNFDNKTRTTLINLNCVELDILGVMNTLNEKQLDFVARTSRTGLRILATNSRLGPKMINSIMELQNEEEKVFLLNLDLKTRSFIEHDTQKQSLSSDGERLWKEMGELNDREKWWMGRMQLTVRGIQMFTYLNRRRAKVFADLFEKIESDEHPVFDVWNGKKPSKFDTKLLANVITAGRPKSIEFLHDWDFLDSIFFMELLQVSVEASCDEEFQFDIIREIRRRDFKVSDLVSVYDYSKRQHVQSLRWILINSLKPGNEILFEFARITLFDNLHGKNNLTFEYIFHPTSEEVLPALHKQFAAEEYTLAKLFFSVSTDSTRLFEILDPAGCSVLLESVKTKDRRDMVPLLRKLPKEKVVEFFDSPSGHEFLHSSLSHGRINLLRFLRQRLTDGDIQNMIRKNDYILVREFLWYPRTGKAAQHSAMILHMLREIDPDIPDNYYISQSIELISAVQFVAPPTRTVSVIRSLMIDPMKLPNLDPRVRSILLNEVTNGCKDTLIPCIDSRDIREIPSGAKYIFNKVRIDQSEIWDAEFDLSNSTILSMVEILWPNSGGFRSIEQIRTRAILSLIAGQHDEIPASDASHLRVIFEIAERITSRTAQVPNGSIVGFLASVGLVDLNIAGNFILLGANTSSSVNIAADYRVPTMVLDQLKEHMLRSEREDHFVYWSMFWNNETLQTQEIEIDTEAGGVLSRFVSRVIDRFEASYDSIGLSLPRWSVGIHKYYVSSLPLAFEEVSGTSALLDSVPCLLKIELTPARLVFDRRAVVREPYGQTESLLGFSHLTKRYKDYHSVCGPGANAFEIDTLIQQASTRSQAFCNSFPGLLHSRILTERYRLTGNVEDRCHNMVVYRKEITSRSNSMLYVNQDHFDWESSRSPSVDLIFLGNEINFVDSGNDTTTTNHFVLKGDLALCKIHKKGLNFFYTDKNEFRCDLDNTQDNVVFVHGDFVDSENISSVIGVPGRNKITISHARFVDGGGGNDEIIALSSTIVRAHFGDLIVGAATVVLPFTVDQIHSITIEPTTFVFWYKDWARIEVDRNCKLMLSNGYYVLPIEEYNESHRIRRIGLRKTLEVHIEYDEQLTELRNMWNANFELVKYSYVPSQIFMITEMDHNVFVTDRDDHHYYWEALPNTRNLYIFTQLNSTATISQANGIMDLASLRINMEDINLVRTKVDLTISYQSVKVILLANYNEVKLTFDGKKYYRLWYNDLERDYCSHPLKMRGTMSIDYLELIHQYNCLEVKSDKLHFVRSKENLILVWNSGTLYLKDYYSFLHNKMDLSLRLNSYTMEPAEVWRRASNPSSIKYYEVDKAGLEIYHNQPVNNYDIGLINLGGWSLKKCDMTISDDDLSISFGVNSSVRVKNWLTHPSSRDVVFHFKDELLLNTGCIISNCYSNDIMDEFENIKSQGRRSKRETNNFGFLFVVLQNWLDRKYPLPVEHCHAPEEIFADAYTLTETFEKALNKTAVESNTTVDGVDFFQVYDNVSKLMRADKYSLILVDFYKIVETVGLDAETFFDNFSKRIQDNC